MKVRIWSTLGKYITYTSLETLNDQTADFHVIMQIIVVDGNIIYSELLKNPIKSKIHRLKVLTHPSCSH